MKRTFTRFSPALLLLLSPFLVFAQTDTGGGTCTNGTAQGLFCYGLEILNDYVVPILFAVAFVVFLYNVYKYFIAGGASEEKVSEGTRFVMWSLVGFFLMLSLWGIINLLVNTIGFGSSSMPALPTFNTTTNTSTSNVGSLLNSSVDPNGTTVENGASMSNTMPAAGGLCPTGYTLSGSTCYLNSAYGIGSTASGSVSAGGTCSQDSDCADLNGQSYGCYKVNGSATGTCTVDGDAPADGTVPPGGACTNDNSCEDYDGDSYGCSNGVCTLNGDANTADGTVPPGGSCTQDSNCADVNGQSYGCYQGQCTLNGDSVTNGVAQGGSCSGGQMCQSGLVCDSNSSDYTYGYCETQGQIDSEASTGDYSGGSVSSQGNTGS